MKKIISVILSAILIFSCVFIPTAFAEPALTLTLAADLHYRSVERVGDMRKLSTYDPDNVFYDATIQGEMDNISEAIISRFLNVFVDSDKEILLIAGDLTDGCRIDHEKLAAIFEKTVSAAAAQGKTKRIYVINGNHDIDGDNAEKLTSADDFKSCYYKSGYENALAVDPGSCSYTAELSGDWRLLAIDSCVYGEDEGEISDERFAWIEKQVEAAKNDGKYLVTMLHHSVVPHFSVQDIPGDFNDRANRLAALGIRHIFTGHMHGNDIAEAVTEDGSLIYDVLTGSLITSPCSYRNITFTPRAVTIETEYVTEIDAGRLPEGLTDEQRDMITNDFPAYAKGFFSAGMSKWLDRYIGSAAKLAKKLKIAEGTPAYEALDFVLGCVDDALNLPLYNTEATPGGYDSVQELCAAYGFVLPESDYKVPGDVVGAVMGAFYAGDENIKYTDKEVRIVYSVVSAGLVYAVTELISLGNDSFTERFFNAIGLRTKVLGLTHTGKLIAGKQAANLLIDIILSPIVEGISTDIYAPGDLNVELPGVNAEDVSPVSPSPLKLSEKALAYFKGFFRVFKEYMDRLFNIKPVVC